MVDGLIFQNLRVPDGNGSGIRLEKGNLSVSNSLFRNSEEGILTGEDRGATVQIDKSTFRHLGRCDRDLDCAHGIYIGRVARLSVTRSRFDQGDGGHYLKTRTPRVTITGNSFDRNGAQVLLQKKTQALQTSGPQLINAMGDFYDSLRPEQQQKVRDFLNRRGGHRGHHGERGPRG